MLKVKELRNKLELSQEELAEKTGIPKGRINNWEQGKGSPKAEDAKILSALLKSTEIQISQIPFYDAVAVGGADLLANQDSINEPTEMIHPGTWFRSAKGALRIYGHSMFPKYPSGSIVAFKSADKEVIIWGEDYVIELQDRRIIKRLEKHSDRNFVNAVSYNKSEEYVYAPIEIPLVKIKRLFMVLGKVELEASI